MLYTFICPVVNYANLLRHLHIVYVRLVLGNDSKCNGVAHDYRAVVV